MADETQKFTPSQMHGLLAAGASRVTRALREWEPPDILDDEMVFINEASPPPNQGRAGL